MENDCIFCKVIKGEIPGTKVTESQNFIVIKDAYPQTKGHSLVIPKEHYENFENLPPELYKELIETTRAAVDYLVEETAMQGYNFIMNNHKIAGQLVPHMHLHIIPRSLGDGKTVIA